MELLAAIVGANQSHPPSTQLSIQLVPANGTCTKSFVVYCTFFINNNNGAQLKATLNPLNTTVLLCTEGFRGSLNWALVMAEMEGHASDRCCFSGFFAVG